MSDLHLVNRHLCSDVQTLNSPRFLEFHRVHVQIPSEFADYSLIETLEDALKVTFSFAGDQCKFEWQKSKAVVVHDMRTSQSWSRLSFLDGALENYLTFCDQITASAHVSLLPPNQPSLTPAPSDAEKLIPDFVALRLEY